MDEEVLKKLRSTLDKADILAWRRREKKLQAVIENKLRPLEDEILQIQLRKVEFFDEINEIRTEMVNSCIHPEEQLVEMEDGILLCKFCNKKLKFYE